MPDETFDVFCFEAFEEEEAALRTHLSQGAPAARNIGYSWKTIQEYDAAEPPAPVISVRTQSVIPESWAPKLKAIVSRSTGYDHLLSYRARTGTDAQLGYLPLYCARAVAEQAILLTMALLRHLPRQRANMDRFSRDGLTGRECIDRRVAVFGVGNIGHEICGIAAALGMRVVGVDLDHAHDDVAYVSREEGLRESEIIICAMDLNDDNHTYFDADAWRQVQPGTLFVNISRGELSPSTAIQSALADGQLGAVALDVFDHESALGVALRNDEVSDDDEVRAAISLMKHPNAICTPHNAFNTLEAVERKSADTATQLAAYFEHGTLLWQAPTED